ncbi:hypothetical protein [Escherichia phage vB_EcoM_EP57]|nr:hypothetical protein [Escherichia phage vB_EcoM_EP57]
MPLLLVIFNTPLRKVRGFFIFNACNYISFCDKIRYEEDKICAIL